MSSINKIYGHSLPQVGTYVNFIFTDRNENVLTCLLTDYNISAIMPITMLTTKKKIRSINKLSPLNKPLIGFVDNIDTGVVTVTLAYNDPESEQYKHLIDTNIYLTQLRKKINQYSHINNISVNKLLETYIYPFDIERVETKSNDNLYMYIINNIEKIYDEQFKKYMIDGHKEFITKESKMFETKFKFISTSGVEYTKQFFTTILQNYNDLNVSIISAPEYRVYSNDTSKNRELQKKFLIELKELSNTFKPTVHIALC